LGICRLIYVVQFKCVISEHLSQSVLSFTRAALVTKVSGGFTRDLQVLPGHLGALPGSPISSTRRLPGHLQALAAGDNLSRTDPGFSKPQPDWPLGNTG